MEKDESRKMEKDGYERTPMYDYDDDYEYYWGDSITYNHDRRTYETRKKAEAR